MAISVENRKIFPLLVFCVTAEGIPFGIGHLTRMMALPGRERSLTIVDTIHQREIQTDRHRATAMTALTHSAAR